MMNFYQFMKKARGSMSLWELSKRTGITVQQLSNYEKEKSKATIEKASAICRALNVTFTIGAREAKKDD